MRKLICACAISMLAAAATAATAQEVERDTKARTRVSVDAGKQVTVTGCVARASDGNYTLTHSSGKDGALGSYVLVADGRERERLGEHVGHRVEVSGRAADQGDGTLTMKTESEVRNSAGDRRKRESTTRIKGDLEGLPLLGVKSVRMLSTVCP